MLIAEYELGLIPLVSTRIGTRLQRTLPEQVGRPGTVNGLKPSCPSGFPPQQEATESCPNPHAILPTSNLRKGGPVTSVGRNWLRSDGSPFPSRPSVFEPQQYASGSRTMPQLLSSPALTIMNL